MAFKETVTAVVVKNAIKYARKDFDKNAPRILSLMEMADVKKVNRSTYAGLHKVLDDPDNNWMRFARDLVCNTDEHVLNQLVQPLMNVAINSYSKRMAAIEKYGCQCAVGDPDGSHRCLQPEVHRLLGCRVRPYQLSVLRRPDSHYHPGQGAGYIYVSVHRR